MEPQPLPPLSKDVKDESKRLTIPVHSADPNNWTLSSDAKTIWTPADESWQAFHKRHYGRDDSTPNKENLEGPVEVLPFEDMPPIATDDVGSILVREAYRTMFDYVWVEGLNFIGRGGTLIIGQPGTGKTMFQIYVLIRLLRKKQIVLFTPDGSFFLFFFHDQVYFMRDQLIHPDLPIPKLGTDVLLWSLCNKAEPAHCLVELPCCPIHTCSPNIELYKVWEKENRPMTTGFPRWTMDELRNALPCQQAYCSLLDKLNENPNALSTKARNAMNELIAMSEDVMYEGTGCNMELSAEATIDCLLQAAIARFGYTPRDVFAAVFDFEETLRIDAGFNTIYDNFKNALTSLATNRLSTGKIPHEILALEPVYSEALQSARWTLDFKSKWVGRNIIDHLAVVDASELREQFLFFKRFPEASILAGIFFENFAFRVIATTTSETDNWPLIRMECNGAADSPRFSLPNYNDLFDNNTSLPKVMRRINPVFAKTDITHFENNVFYKPVERSHPLFDGFIVNISDSSADLWLFKMTFSPHNEGSAKGYPRIRKLIGSLKDQIKEERPRPPKSPKSMDKQTATDVVVKVRYLLVVPYEGGPCGDYATDKHVWQLPHGWDKDVEENDHRGDVYCLTLRTLNRKIY